MAEHPSGELMRYDEFMRTYVDTLLRVIAYSAKEADLATSEGDALWLARDILTEAHHHALAQPNALDETPDMMNLMMSLACDVLLLRQTERAALLGTAQPRHAAGLTEHARAANKDAEDFDWVVGVIMARAAYDSRITNAMGAEFERRLDLVSPADAAILRLGVLESLDGEVMASRLGCTPGEARLRFHEAFSRLRELWQASDRPFGHQ